MSIDSDWPGIAHVMRFRDVAALNEACNKIADYDRLRAELEKVSKERKQYREWWNETVGEQGCQIVEALRAENMELRAENVELRKALEDIRDWKLPEPGDGHSYGWHWGSRGEQEYIRKVATEALHRSAP
jgi:hypothetical protein